MIGWLKGVVAVRDVTVGEVILDVNGVGYLVVVSWQTMAAVGDVGEPCTLWIHTHVRAEALSLFGFATPEERRMFRLLTSVPQVGPKNAIGVLGGFPLTQLLGAIGDGERGTLERIPGVGKRTAERILLDLKDKVEPLQQALALGRGSARTEAPAKSGDDPRTDEARAVLVNLGWKPKLVDAALSKVVERQPSTDGQDDERALDGLVRLALVELMSR